MKIFDFVAITLWILIAAVIVNTRNLTLQRRSIDNLINTLTEDTEEEHSCKAVPGIELQVAMDGKPLLQLDSKQAHYVAIQGGYGQDEKAPWSQGAHVPPGWYNLLHTIEGLDINCRPIMISPDVDQDEYYVRGHQRITGEA